ncbi:MAG: DUF2059 domain-containing protein, partial [Methylacidiphilales bacterium]|nr:DUF2059 domain-containing protein [Candidatus Methylacidiphilales bacterium]
DETSSKQQLIRQLLSLTKANDPQTIADQFSASASAQLALLAQQFTDGQATLKKSLAEAAQKFSIAIIPRIEKIYMDTFSSFSIQDLQTIVNFYSTEAGQKFNNTLLSISPQLISASTDPSVIQPLTQEIIRAFTLASPFPSSLSPSSQENTAMTPEPPPAPSSPPTSTPEEESAPDKKSSSPDKDPSQANP